MTRLFMAMLATCLAAPVSAQDLGAEFLNAYRTFGNASGDFDYAQAAMTELVPTLVGRWFPIGILLGAGGPVVDQTPPEFDSAPFCSRLVYDLVQIGPRSFSTLWHDLENPDSAQLTTLYTYSGMNQFVRYVDEAQMLAMLGFEDGIEPPGQTYLGLRHGDVLLYHPSPNIMVFVSALGQTEYLARCP